MAADEYEEQEYRIAELSELREHPDNPRLGDVGAISVSIEANGMYGALVVQKSTMYVLAGNHRLKALRALNRKRVPVIIRDVDDVTAMRILLGDNRHSDLASYDNVKLAELLIQAALDGNLLGTGYDGDDVDQLLTDARRDLLPLGAEDGPLLPKNPRSKPGELYQLGPHRLLCGDATLPEDAAKLMDGEHASLLFTSPPYGDARDYDPDSGADLKPSSLARFLPIYADHADLISVNLGVLRRNQAILRYWDEYIAAAEDAGLKLLAWNVWDRERSGTVIQQTMMFPLHHEFIFVFGERAIKLNRRVRNKGAGDRMQNPGMRERDGSYVGYRNYTVRDYSALPSVVTLGPAVAPRDERGDHPAIFPAGLPEAYILAASDRDEIVIDCFAGSGTTMLAAHTAGRRCYMVEISPAYCDVIRDRWEQLAEVGADQDAVVAAAAIRAAEA
jgi:DNA modification methylase